MPYNKDKVDEIVLALMQLGLHDMDRTWKSFDWDSMDRLYKKGLISDPVNKNKSVILTEKGLEMSKALFEKHFVVE
jgi:hypothetical protein